MVETLTSYELEDERKFANYYVSPIRPKFNRWSRDELSSTDPFQVEWLILGSTTPVEGLCTSGVSWENLHRKTYWFVAFEEIDELSELSEKITNIVSEVENEPLQLLSRDLLDELKEYTKTELDIPKMKQALEKVLDDFSQKKLGVQMESQTRQFLMNELVYLLIKTLGESQ